MFPNSPKSISVWVTCPECKGKRTIHVEYKRGWKEYKADLVCSRCKGVGQIQIRKET